MLTLCRKEEFPENRSLSKIWTSIQKSEACPNYSDLGSVKNWVEWGWELVLSQVLSFHNCLPPQKKPPTKTTNKQTTKKQNPQNPPKTGVFAAYWHLQSQFNYSNDFSLSSSAMISAQLTSNLFAESAPEKCCLLPPTALFLILSCCLGLQQQTGFSLDSWLTEIAFVSHNFFFNNTYIC